MSRSLASIILLPLVFLASTMLAPSPALGVVNGIEAPCDDRRFDAIGLFTYVGTNTWPCGGYTSGSCILIGPDMVLIARHSIVNSPTTPLPDPNELKYRVRFRRAVNGEAQNHMLVNGDACHGVYQEMFITQFVDAPIRNSDMVLGYLEHPVKGIRPVGLEINNPPTRVINVMLIGWGYSGACLQTGEHWTLRYARGKTPDNTALSDYLVFSPCVFGSTAPCLICPAGGPFIMANTHDSGAGVFIEVPSTSPLDPTPELRLISTVSTTTSGRRPIAWNHAGGVPQLTQAPAASNRTPADFNLNGAVTVDDLFEYLNAFFASACLADSNHNGAVTTDDVFVYLNTFFAAQ